MIVHDRVDHFKPYKQIEHKNLTSSRQNAEEITEWDGGTYIVSYTQALQALSWSLHTESEIASKLSNEVQVSVDASGLFGRSTCICNEPNQAGSKIRPPSYPINK